MNVEVASAILGVVGVAGTLFGLILSASSIKSQRASSKVLNEANETLKKVKDTATQIDEVSKETQSLQRGASREFTRIKDDIQAVLLGQHRPVENLGELIAYMYVALTVLKQSDCLYLANFAAKFGKAHEVSQETKVQLRNALGEISQMPVYAHTNIADKYIQHKDNVNSLHREVISAIEDCLLTRAREKNFGAILLKPELFDTAFLQALARESNNKYSSDYSALAEKHIRDTVIQAEERTRDKLLQSVEGVEGTSVEYVDSLPIQFICGKLTSNNTFFPTEQTGGDERDRWLTLVFFIGTSSLFNDSSDTCLTDSPTYLVNRPSDAIGVFSRGSRFALTCMHLYGWVRTNARAGNVIA